MDWQEIETAPRDGRIVKLGWIVNPPQVEAVAYSRWKSGAALYHLTMRRWGNE